MREILFRGKTKYTKTWIYGFYGENTSTGEPQIVAKSDFCYSIVIPETVGQYTGLCDKNGKKVFEGDIIHSLYANCKINEHIEKVVFRDGAFKSENAEGGFFAKIAGQGSPKHLPNDTSVYMIECEIIGNIHDNPELLEGGEQR